LALAAIQLPLITQYMIAFAIPGSVVRFTDSREHAALPSAEALGYSLSVRFADEDKNTFEVSR